MMCCSSDAIDTRFRAALKKKKKKNAPKMMTPAVGMKK